MKYFFDTEFIEGKQPVFLPFSTISIGKTKPTIDLISIGIKAEDGREYYAISKDFNLKEAWTRKDIKYEVDKCGVKVIHDYWLNTNVLTPIFWDLYTREYPPSVTSSVTHLSYKICKSLLKKYGKSNDQIAEEVCHFIDQRYVDVNYPKKGFIYPGDTSIKKVNTTNLEFYAYYGDYDWVVFCWLFGKMLDLPKGFPMYCNDLKQILEEKSEKYILDNMFNPVVNVNWPEKMTSDILKMDKNYPKEINSHNALGDARWNFALYNFLEKI
jgi:hypothetical protein